MQPDSQDGEQELFDDRVAYRLAFATMREHPGLFLLASLKRWTRFWGLVPHLLSVHETVRQATVRWTIGGFYLIELSLAAWGAYLLRKRMLEPPWLWGLLLVASFMAVHTFYWTDMRMRAPLVPVIALAAGVAIAKWTTRHDASLFLEAA